MEYFQSHVLPVITVLLGEISESGGRCLNESTSRTAESPINVPLSVRTIAQRLAVRNASDIMKAAAVSLVLAQGRDKFSRNELIEEAARAVGYWRKSHAESAQWIIKYLVSADALVEAADGNYSLHPEEERLARAALGC